MGSKTQKSETRRDKELTPKKGPLRDLTVRRNADAVRGGVIREGRSLNHNETLLQDWE
jgi:hypothetical protein